MQLHALIHICKIIKYIIFQQYNNVYLGEMKKILTRINKNKKIKNVLIVAEQYKTLINIADITYK